MYRLIMSENILTIVCAGMEKEIFDFLRRKGVDVIDDVCGPADAVLEAYLMGKLAPGQFLLSPPYVLKRFILEQLWVSILFQYVSFCTCTFFHGSLLTQPTDCYV